MISEIEALIDQGIDIDRPVLSRPLTRVQQHVFDDSVGTLAVLHDLVQIALQLSTIVAKAERGELFGLHQAGPAQSANPPATSSVRAYGFQCFSRIGYLADLGA